ncbi:acetyltransferase (GNAT) family protein [Hoeflea sp. IMCC20628]|uniref:GNAT family N-acetyltransferase n=1 Tax=Hoeflea sp. IMCC20628 TaxID=1620421 RepID=UPI00063BE888|nr:GNAT family N-acetyltransferase [Hoeflea sp. IMCC20628]AKI01381.1 acetyltransferase (GNAT) family protein [Hoeflea sp. IMCC20628]
MTIEQISIRPAVVEDAAALNQALAQLSADMGDVHRASDADIARFGFGESQVFHTLLAETAVGAIVGVAAYSPFFSTTLGTVGIYVSDLWVAESARGQQLGVRLLAAVRDAGATDWDASFIRLNVYHSNPRARGFYERLGFVAYSETQFMTLAGEAMTSLGVPS